MKIIYMWAVDKDTNMKAIFIVTNLTWTVVKIRPEKKIQVMGSNPLQAWIFLGLIFTTAYQVVFITAKMALIFMWNFGWRLWCPVVFIASRDEEDDPNVSQESDE